MDRSVPETLISQSPGPDVSEVVCLLNHDGIIRFATPAAAQFYGHDSGSIVGRAALRFIAPEDVDRVVARWEAFSRDPSVPTAEMRVTTITASGRRIPIRVSVWRLPDGQNFLLVHHIFDHVRDRLETLYGVLSAMSSTLVLDTLLDTVLREVQRLIPCGTSTIFILERDKTVRVRRWHEGVIQDYRSLIHEHLPEFETSRIIRESGRPLVISDTTADPHWVELPEHRPIRSWLGAPLAHRGQFLGELNLDSAHPNAFTEEDAALAHALASQIAAALHNARQFEEEQRRAGQFQAISDVSQAISQLDLPSVLEVVYRKISQLMNTTTFFIGLYDAEAEQIHIVGSYDHGKPRPDEIQPSDAGLSGLVIRTRQPLIIHDSASDPVPDAIIVQDEMPRSLLMMPLITQDEVVGVISVQSYEPNAYTDDDIFMLEIVAGAVATAVRNAQLYDQTAERLAALGKLHAMSIELASDQPIDTIIQLVIKAALDLFAPDQVRLCLCGGLPWDSTTWIGHPGARCAEALPSQAHGLLAEQVSAANEPMILSNIDHDSPLQQEFDLPWRLGAAALYPILSGERRLAVLTLLYDKPHIFRTDMLRTLDLLCNQVATAFDNTRYTITLRRRLQEVTALNDLARRLSSMQSLDEIMETVVHTLRDVYQCRSASLALLDEDSQEVITRAAAGLEPQFIEAARFKVGEYVAGNVITSGQAIYVPDTTADPDFRVVDPGIRSLLTVPLTVQGHVIGTLGIDSAEPHAFTPDHERVLTIAGGQIAASIETVRLLQETRERADQLTVANATLEAQDALRKELIYQVSHDLRGPLQIIYGYADMMRDGMLGTVTPTQTDVLSLIVKRSRSIERMTHDIMISRPISRDMLELAPVNLTEMCQQAMIDVQVMCQDDRFLFAADLVPKDLPVMADYNRLSRVFDNLINNAIKFSPEGGTVRLTTYHDTAQGCALVSIADQGIGIAAEKLEYVFERFFRGDRAFRKRFDGSGLGLYIVQQIIEAHNGRVWVESQEGEGSTFTFALPIAER